MKYGLKRTYDAITTPIWAEIGKKFQADDDKYGTYDVNYAHQYQSYLEGHYEVKERE